MKSLHSILLIALIGIGQLEPMTKHDKLLNAIDRANVKDVNNALKNVNPNQKSATDFTPLMYIAIKDNANEKHIEIMQALVDHGADLDITNKEGLTALMIAALNGNERVVKFLLDNKALINLQNNTGYTALMLAADKGYKDIVQMLMNAGADTAKATLKGNETALMLAVKERRYEIIQLLLGQEVLDPTRPVEIKPRIASLAVSGDQENNQKKKNTLLKIKAAANMQNIDGRTALMEALGKKRIGIAQLLIESGVDLNRQDKWGQTALIEAVERGNLPIIRRLVAYKKIDLNKQNLYGETALMAAIELNNLEIVNLLIANKADLNKQDKQGKTALLRALDKGNLEIIRLLIEGGADLDIASNEGKIALIKALDNAYFAIASLMIKRGADINKPNAQGQVPLEIVIARHERGGGVTSLAKANYNIIKLLMRAGAKIPQELQSKAVVMELQKVVKEQNSVQAKNLFAAIRDQKATPDSIREHISALLKQGYKVTSLVDDLGENMLHKVAVYLSPLSEVAKFLVYYFPALITKPNNKGRTPLELAAANDVEMANLFMNRLARMPEVFKKKFWESLSPAEKKEAQIILGKPKQPVSESQPIARKRKEKGKERA